jgi:hypothetical protein
MPEAGPNQPFYVIVTDQTAGALFVEGPNDQ